MEDAIAAGSLVHTDGWLSYLPSEQKGYRYRVTVLRGKLFFRLVQQAIAVEPAPYKSMVKCAAGTKRPDHNM